jgi:hypothetical protein
MAHIIKELVAVNRPFFVCSEPSYGCASVYKGRVHEPYVLLIDRVQLATALHVAEWEDGFVCDDEWE